MAANLTREGEKRRIEQAASWLERVGSLRGYERALEASAREQLERASGLRSISSDAERVTGSKSTDRLEKAVISYMEITEQMAELSISASRDIEQAVTCISRIENPLEATVLHLHYIDGKPWSVVAETVNYSRRCVMDMRNRALLHIYDVMPHSEREPVHSAL